MTALTVTGTGHRAGRLDGALAYADARIHALMMTRAARRSADAQRAGAQDRAVDARRRAEALGALGVLPR